MVLTLEEGPSLTSKKVSVFFMKPSYISLKYHDYIIVQKLETKNNFQRLTLETLRNELCKVLPFSNHIYPPLNY